jgi:hypothetical protein
MSNCFAQFETDDTDDLYRRETTFGINFATNGGAYLGGFSVKVGLRAGEKSFHHLYLDVANIKHPKELSVSNQRTGRSFVANKSNYLYTIRTMYGREWVLFKKAKQQGVQVNLIAAGGISWGLVTPYLIDYNDGKEINVQYNPDKHPELAKIDGYGSLIVGLSRAKLNMGSCFKTGLSFEIGAFRSSVTGIEVGVMVDAFPNKIILMPKTENTNLFQSIYLSIYFGSRKL